MLFRSIGVVIGTANAGIDILEIGWRRILGEGKKPMPLTIPMTMGNAPASRIAREIGARGPVFAVTTACASASHAMLLGLMLLRNDLADVMVVGGTDSCFNSGFLQAWDGLRVVSPTICRPFSKDRQGLTIGEGAGIIVLEKPGRATARGARVHGRLTGAAMSSDASDLTTPDGVGMRAAMLGALADAGLDWEKTDKSRVGVYLGITEHGNVETENEIHNISQFGNDTKYWTHHHNPRTVANNPAGEVTMNLGITGPHYTIGAACAAGNAGLIQAAQMLQLGEVDLAFAGGVSESIHTFGIFAGFKNQGALAQHADQGHGRAVDHDRRDRVGGHRHVKSPCCFSPSFHCTMAGGVSRSCLSRSATKGNEGVNMTENLNEFETRLGVTYATHDSVALAGDLYLPKGAGPFPALVGVHGGGWVQGARGQFQYWGRYLAARGIALFAISYRFAKTGQKKIGRAHV